MYTGVSNPKDSIRWPSPSVQEIIPQVGRITGRDGKRDKLTFLKEPRIRERQDGKRQEWVSTYPTHRVKILSFMRRLGFQ